jgi:hypothetical protein
MSSILYLEEGYAKFAVERIARAQENEPNKILAFIVNSWLADHSEYAKQTRASLADFRDRKYDPLSTPPPAKSA